MESMHPRMGNGERLSGPEQFGRVLDVSDRLDVDFDGVDCRHAARTAMNWRMGARLFADITRCGLRDRLPSDALDSLHGAHLATAMRNRVMRRRGLEVLRHLDSAGIRPIVRKGWVELLCTPAGTDCTRFMEDLDLLVSPDAYTVAAGILAGLGFTDHSDHDVAEDHHGPPLPKSTPHAR